MRDALGSVQRVLVLGGTSDIATAIVDELASRSRLIEVVLACRRPSDADPTIARLAQRGVTARAITFDARNPGDHAAVVDEAAAGGDIDVVVMAVGVLGSQQDAAGDPAVAYDLCAVNMAGSCAALLAAADRLRDQGHGHIAVLSSVAGVRVRQDNFVYGSTKAGLDGFAQGLAASLEGSGVSVTIVRPGFVHTSMTEGMDPAPFATDAATVARLTVAGLEGRRRVVWAPSLLGPVFAVLRLLPAPVWRRLSARS